MGIDFSRAPHAWEKEKSNFVALLDLRLERVEHGKAVMRMPYRSEITNGTGAVHGGAIVSLCDTVFYVALASIYGREQDTTTIALQCNFLAPAGPPHEGPSQPREDQLVDHDERYHQRHTGADLRVVACQPEKYPECPRRPLALRAGVKWRRT